MYNPSFRIRAGGVPVIRDMEIDAHAEAFVKDFKPELIENPQPIDVDEFAEYYLGLKLDFDHLSHDGQSKPRARFTTLPRQTVPVTSQLRDYSDNDR